MSEFKVPKQAVEQIGETPETTTNTYPALEEDFEVSDRVVQDLDSQTSNTSDAHELMGDDSLQEKSEVVTPPQPEDDWVVKRNALLSDPGWNVSFLGGATAGTFARLTERKQKKVIALSKKLIEAYSDRGVSEPTVGLLDCNPDENWIRANGGSGWVDSPDQYWLVHLGVPLTDERHANGKRESEQASIRYHGLKRGVVNVYDTEVVKNAFLPRGRVPVIRDDEWLPAVLATEANYL